jgi:hypothetical protein
MGIYDRSYFQDIFLEERLKEYLEELERIWNQDMKCVRGNIVAWWREMNTLSFSRKGFHFFWRKIMYWIQEKRMKKQRNAKFP